MHRTCIAVVDATRARLFTYDRSTEPEGPREQLVERADLVHPARRRRPSELFRDTRPGSSRTGALGYAFDDRRAASLQRMDADFARQIVDELQRLLGEAPVARLVVCASPRMLGVLRDVIGPRKGIVIDELARDLVKLTPAQLRRQLAAGGLLPPEPPRAALSM